MRCVINDEIKRFIKLCLKNVSKRRFVCLVGLPVCLDPFTYTARVDVTVKITRIYLVLDVEGDVSLGFEQFKPERSAAAVKDPELNYLLWTEIDAA